LLLDPVILPSSIHSGGTQQQLSLQLYLPFFGNPGRRQHGTLKRCAIIWRFCDNDLILYCTVPHCTSFLSVPGVSVLTSIISQNRTFTPSWCLHQLPGAPPNKLIIGRLAAKDRPCSVVGFNPYGTTKKVQYLILPRRQTTDFHRQRIKSVNTQRSKSRDLLLRVVWRRQTSVLAQGGS
jgi:hypothetical protein